jgi:hypothetical protein
VTRLLLCRKEVKEMKYPAVILGILLMGAIAASAQVDLTIDVTPDEVYPGEWVTIDVCMVNLTEEFQFFWIWGELEIDEELIAKTPPIPMILRPGWELSFSKRFKIHPRLSPGEYTVNVYLGMYPDEVWDEEHVTLTVLES